MIYMLYVVKENRHISWKPDPKVIKIVMLNSAKHEIFSAHKCLNTKNCWLFTIYELEK